PRAPEPAPADPAEDPRLVPLRAVPGLDVVRGLEFTPGSDAGFYLQMLGIFVDSYRDCEERLRVLLAAGDPASADRLVHNCKGAAATLGAVPLAGLAAELEGALRSEPEGETVPGLVDAFGRQVTEFTQALQRVLPG